MENKFWNRKIGTIRVGELATFLGVYVFFSAFYYLTLWFNRLGYDNPNDWVFKPSIFFNDSGLDYALKMILTIPIWFLLFRKLRSWTISRRLLLHLILLPTFVLVWKRSYYFLSEMLGYGHLIGAGEVWDIYIPALLYILQFGIIHSYNYYLENQAKLILEGELRSAALKSELSAIKAQLNPHFLYNIFNAINASLPPENEKTRRLIAELSDMFRYQLKASQVEMVSLKEELDFVKKYLDLEKERLQERLEVIIDVDPKLYVEQIPPMLLQPLVENSIKHGISPLIQGGKVIIAIHRRNNKLVFEISDTGVGVEDYSQIFAKGIGLTNTQLRLQKMYNSSLSITENKPQGVYIKFEI